MFKVIIEICSRDLFHKPFICTAYCWYFFT